VSALSLSRFAEFFEALHGQPPYDWQRRLAEAAAHGRWPDLISVPTGSGKTAAIDVAIFAMACQASLPVGDRRAPRRVFFCVNRRVIVDEACERARRISERLELAESGDGILAEVARALRAVGGATSNDGPLLDVIELRGGIHRDNRWARSATQPAVIGTTVDQLGSRLLFRGYGVSRGAAPIQAALIAYDSLILLDEAHISTPFRETLAATRSYLDPTRWAADSIGVQPMRLVCMTATLPDAADRDAPSLSDSALRRIDLSDVDRAPGSPLARRLAAAKPAELAESKRGALDEDAAMRAVGWAVASPTAIAVMVNRVRTARDVYRLVRQELAKRGRNDIDIELVIGSMRPLDRDAQARRLRPLIGPERPAVSTVSSIVISTQCLEVGADYDFDAMITECAALDALRQRFGRLNRAGREIEVRAAILVGRGAVKELDKLDDDKPIDPIYGNALARTWHWLGEHATDGVVDFGIDAMSAMLASGTPTSLLSPTVNLHAPVMLPTHLDRWCQTTLDDAPDEPIEVFLHGPDRGEPTVQVCWRSDLVVPGDDASAEAVDPWLEIVGMLPPVSAECMSVPISRVREWLSAEGETPVDLGDTIDGASPEEDDRRRPQRRARVDAVLWRGARDSRVVVANFRIGPADRIGEEAKALRDPLARPDDVRPGDTVVLSVESGGWEGLGHIPGARSVLGHPSAMEAAADNSDGCTGCWIDAAELAHRRARGRDVIRLHPAALRGSEHDKITEALIAFARHPEGRPTKEEWMAAVRALVKDPADRDSLSLPPRVEDLLERLETARTPEGATPMLSQALRDRFSHLGRPVVRYYPDDAGVMLFGAKRVQDAAGGSGVEIDDGDGDAPSHVHGAAVTLERHTNDVIDAVTRALDGLPLSRCANGFRLAAELHDLGKADPRFQALLRGVDRSSAAAAIIGGASALLAKSGGAPRSRWEHDAARMRAGLPERFRHETLSVQFAERDDRLASVGLERDLVLHLIASHHGHGRPLVPIVIDDASPTVRVGNRTLTADDRRALAPPHRVDSGIAPRFEVLTRRFGWWGLAYLEAILRLADAAASADADRRGSDDTDSSKLGAADMELQEATR